LGSRLRVVYHTLDNALSNTFSRRVGKHYRLRNGHILVVTKKTGILLHNWRSVADRVTAIFSLRSCQCMGHQLILVVIKILFPVHKVVEPVNIAESACYLPSHVSTQHSYSLP
jgi:hypothetical protein